MITQDAIDRLKALQTDTGFPSAGELYARLETDEELRNEIRFLAKTFIKQEVGNCTNCLIDSYVLLKKLDINKAMKQETSQFALKAGVVLSQGAPQDKWMTNRNCTDELATYWIKKDPSCLKFFSKVPDNINALIEEPAPTPEPEPAPEPQQQEKKKSTKKAKSTK